jgi:predicted dehydrogenase
MSPPTARIGVVGVGRWALQHHLPQLMAHPRAQVVAVADPNPARLAFARERFGVHHTYRTAVALLSAGDLDGVVVATSNAAHYPVARAALDRGLHVLVEKPMTVEPADAWDLVQRARDGGRHLVVGYPFQFTEGVSLAQNLVGDLGALHLVSAVYSAPRGHLYRPTGGTAATDPDPATYADPAVSGGGQGQTEATHAVANLLHVGGLQPNRVNAFTRRHGHAVDVVDTMMFEFAGGAIGTLATTGVVPERCGAFQRFSFYGERGVLHQNLTTGALHGYVADTPIRLPGAPPERRYPTHRPAACLVDLITGARTDNPAPGGLGAMAVSCIAAAYRSARSGGGPVDVARPGTTVQSDHGVRASIT